MSAPEAPGTSGSQFYVVTGANVGLPNLMTVVHPVRSAGDADKVKHEREVLANMSDGWGPFLASSNAQLLDVRIRIYEPAFSIILSPWL